MQIFIKISTGTGRSSGRAAAAAIRAKSTTSKTAAAPIASNNAEKRVGKRGRPKANDNNAAEALGTSTTAVASGSVEKKGWKRGPPKANDNDNNAAEALGTSASAKSNTPVAPSKSKKSKLKQVPGAKLGKDFFDQDTVTLAKAVLRKVLCRRLPDTGQVLKGTVVETEAYAGAGDAASQTFKGEPTPASMPLFMDPGTAYIYMTYGMYHCFNISSKDAGGGVLLRALEVHEDYEIMQDLRNPKKKKKPEDGNPDATSTAKAKTFKRHELANGPSKLCLSFNITKDLCNKLDMNTSDDLWLETSTNDQYFQQLFEMDVSRRVGIDRAPPEARYQLHRFFVKDNMSVSQPKFKNDPPPSKGGKGRKSKK